MNADTKFLRLSKLRSLRETEQVAAVCYRFRGTEIEFLLVQTGGGRWIFPKGSVEPGLTHAQAAAIEAFEEAGVHGRIEEAPFTRYRVRRSGKQLVSAHLCEVLRLGPPQESGRNRTWFSPEKSKGRLQKDRPASEGAALARVINRAVILIQKSRQKSVVVPETVHYQSQNDPLQKVQVEARPSRLPQGQIDALYMRYIRRLSQEQAGDLAGSLLSRPVPRLSGTVAAASAIQKVTAIDQARRGKARI